MNKLIFINKNCKKHFIAFWMFFCIIILSIQYSSTVPVKSSSLVNRNYCRNHIFSPRCRGQQKRDLTSHASEDYRLPNFEDISSRDRSREMALIQNSLTLIGEMLQNIMETTSTDSENEANNYVK